MVKRTKMRKVKEEHRRKPAKVQQKSDMWQFATIALGVLLIVSIFTSGFRLGTTVNSVLNDLNTLQARESSPQVKSAISGAISQLENIKDAQPKPSDRPTDKPTGGKVIVEEFSDFQCPFCGRAVPTVQQIKQEYGDKIEFVYKHFPLSSIHPLAQKAAEASECARDQGEFWAYHDKLFESGALADADLKKHAADLGLDTTKFNNCLDNGDKTSVVTDDFNEGRQRGVSGTPTFFINGQKLVGALPYSSFKPVIDAALSGEAPAEPEPIQPIVPTQPIEIRTSIDDDPVKGSDDAKVVIVEFSDFQCPFCGRHYTQTLPEIEKEYIDTGKVKLVYRDFPLSFHEQATPAAEASECVHEQGKFWEFHDLAFENQGSLSLDTYKKWAEELSLDIDQFNDCVDSRKYKDEVVKDMNDGSAAGVQGTPGFVIGVLQDDGKTVVGQSVRGAQPYSAFKSVIEEELAKV